ncbi:MAG: BON domain-containing protein [Deltaproteobacteria bacterium]
MLAILGLSRDVVLVGGRGFPPRDYLSALEISRMARRTSPFSSDGKSQSHAEQELVSRVTDDCRNLSRAVASRMAIEVNGGVVTLRGDVPSFYIRQVLVHRCQRIPGVVVVNDELKVHERVGDSGRDLPDLGAIP